MTRDGKPATPGQRDGDNPWVRHDGRASRTIRWLATTTAVVSIVATAASIWLYRYNVAHTDVRIHYLFGDALAGVLYPVTGAFLVRRRPDNRVGWIFAATSVLGVNAFCNQYAVTSYLVSDGGLPLGSVSGWVAAWGWTPEMFVSVLLPLIFPNGTLPSPRWRGYAKFALAVLGALIVIPMLGKVPLDATDKLVNPLGVTDSTVARALMIVAALLSLFVLTPVSVTSLVLRMRRATGTERSQLQWLSFAGVIAVVAAVAATAFSDPWSEVAWTVGVAAIPTGVLIAVVRHQLLDIEVVLNRTVVYVLLSGAVLLAYVAAVAGVGEAAQQRTGIVAVAVLALVVASARDRVQRLVDRALFGDRKDPYAVVSRVGRRLDVATGPQDALKQLVDEVREALRLPYVAVVPANPLVPPVESGRAVAGTEDLPVLVLGEQLAVLTVGRRHHGERFRDDERSVLEDVARRAGALVQAAALVAELLGSRERIVAAREEERRRLRRDLHDGVGPELAGMALQLDSLATRLDRDPQLAERATRLRDRMRSTVVEVRRVVDNLRPPALDELGLVEALRQHVSVYSLAGAGARGDAGAVVDVVVDGELPALPAATEVAAYRIASESVANAVRHGRATRCTVRLRVDDGLCVEVRDDGTGIAAGAVLGVGLQSMCERAAEIGGRLEIESGEGGTTVRSWLPLETR